MAQYPLDEFFQVFCCSLTSSFPCKFAACSKQQAKINYCAAPYLKDVTRERVKPQKKNLYSSLMSKFRLSCLFLFELFFDDESVVIIIACA